MLENFIKTHNLKSYRIDQFNKDYYVNAIKSFDELTTWPAHLREDLKKEVEFMTLDAIKTSTSEDGQTLKVLFRQKSNNKLLETVLMKHDDKRNTVCVSCMIGCPVNCSFCATGKMGFDGNLTSQEIIDQVLFFQRVLMAQDEKITNIVFMGMGEPMLNLKNVLDSVAVFTDENKMAMSSRRITISTSGFIPQIEELMETGFKGRLAVSLHAPNQKLREKLMPVALSYGLDELFETLDEYVKVTNKRISYEYILIEEINDTLEHAEELSELLKDRLAHVNLIPYNPVEGENFIPPSRNRVHRFAKVLKKNGIPHTIRITMGDDIKAACGQLAVEQISKK